MSRLSDFIAAIRERGTRFLDKLGRGRSAADHARTVLQDAVVDTYNGAQLIRAAALGSPGVSVSDALLGDTDEECERADGQKWSIAYALANKKEHPNCTRSFAVLKPGDTSPSELDRE